MTLILADWLITDAAAPPQPGSGVRIVGDRIDGVGSNDELRSRHPADDIIDASGHVVLPGFVNAHVHAYGTLAHGIPVADGPTDFWSFLDDYWWPKVEDRLDHQMIAAATDYVCAEMLRSGITSFYDILEAPNALPGALQAQKEVVEERGLRARLSFEATERAGPDIARLSLQENLDLIDSCVRGDLIDGLVCWHTVFTCSPAFIAEAVRMAHDRGVLYHAHVNEGLHEPEWAEEHLGQRTLEFYADAGIAGPGFLASQCVQLSDRERQVIAERDVRVTHMPLANCEVGGGIAPIPELLDAGVIVGLGSDGYINDFFDVMRGAFLLHKARLQDPGTMPASTVLHLATDGGAQALGLDGVGRLDPGWAADLQVVDLELPTPVTAHNLAEQLVLWRNRHHVRDVMVAGTWRVRNGDVLNADLGRLKAKTREQALRLWSQS